MPRGKAQKSLDLISACHDILTSIQPASVRAVCYQLFVRKLIDSMSKANTNRVSRQLVYAREAGLIPWHWVVDETRDLERQPSWADPEHYIHVVERSYRRDRWKQQPVQVEVWSEKGTVRGTLSPVLDAYGVGFRVMHGYGSATIIHDVAARTGEGRESLLVLYVGDWDPSGMHMSAVDLPSRLEDYGGKVKLERIALVEYDVEDTDLPSFDAADKRKDPRWGWFTERYGTRCWELDALNPTILRERLERVLRGVIDWDAWERCGRVETAEKETLRDVLGAWREASA